MKQNSFEFELLENALHHVMDAEANLSNMRVYCHDKSREDGYKEVMEKLNLMSHRLKTMRDALACENIEINRAGEE